MKKVLMIALMVMIAFINLLPAASGSLNANWLPMQTKWVIHFDHSVFSQTKIFSIVDRHWKDDRNSVQSELLDELDIDLAKDLRGLTVVGLDQLEKGDNIMVILQGNFDQNRLIKRIKNKERKAVTKTVAGLNVISWGADSHLFFPENDVIVFCETKTGIDEMVKLMKGKVKAISGSSPLLKMLSEAPRNAFVRAAVVDVSALTKFAPKTMVLDSASVAFFMALEDRENLSMMLKLVTESEKKAQNLQQIISGLRALVSLKALDDDDDDKGILDLVNGLDVSTEGSRLVMRFDYPVDKVGHLLNDIQDKKAKKKVKIDRD